MCRVGQNSTHSLTELMAKYLKVSNRNGTNTHKQRTTKQTPASRVPSAARVHCLYLLSAWSVTNVKLGRLWRRDYRWQWHRIQVCVDNWLCIWSQIILAQNTARIVSWHWQLQLLLLLLLTICIIMVALWQNYMLQDHLTVSFHLLMNWQEIPVSSTPTPQLSAPDRWQSVSTEHRRPLPGTNFHCLVTKAHVCEQLAQSCYKLVKWRGVKLQRLDRDSITLITTPPCHITASKMASKQNHKYHLTTDPAY